MSKQNLEIQSALQMLRTGYAGRHCGNAKLTFRVLLKRSADHEHGKYSINITCPNGGKGQLIFKQIIQFANQEISGDTRNIFIFLAFTL